MEFDINHPYNNPEYIKSELERFSSTNWAGKNIHDIYKEYTSRFITLPAYIIRIKSGTILYRARVNDRKNLNPFKQVKDLGINPKENIKSFGRANLPNQAVFYGSSDAETAAREVTQWYLHDSGRYMDLITKKSNAFWGDSSISFMTISSWMVTEDLNLALMTNERFPDSSESVSENIRVSYNMILDFFSNEFAKQTVKSEFDYIYSAYYANQIYRSRLNQVTLDGVQYVSIANNGKGENIAISNTSFQKLDFLGANYGHVYNNVHGKMKDVRSTVITTTHVATLQGDSTLTWQGYPELYETD